MRKFGGELLNKPYVQATKQHRKFIPSQKIEEFDTLKHTINKNAIIKELSKTI